ncbi:MAG: glycosyltransferase [Thermoproteota archaeon]
MRSKVYLIKNYKRGAPLDFLRSLISLYKLSLYERVDAMLGCKSRGRNLVSFCLGIKRFFRIETHPYNPPIRGLSGKIPYWIKTRILYRLPRKIFTISEAISEYLITHYKIPARNILLVYNPIDIDQICQLVEEPLDNGERILFSFPVIVSCARLDVQKGQWHLIRSFKPVSEVLPDCKLVFIGDGPLRGYLEGLVTELGLKDKVFFLGWKSNPFKYMARSTLFCLSSLWEGFPNVVVEALACGLPVMSTDCLSGPREILAPGTEYKVDRLRGPEYAEYGILMPVFDGKRYTARDPLTWQEEMWAEEIVKLLKNPEILENYRQRAKRRAMDFEAKKQVQKYFDVIFNQS